MTCEAMSDHIFVGERTWARLRSRCPKDAPKMSRDCSLNFEARNQSLRTAPQVC
jgi:hypothetical protein